MQILDHPDFAKFDTSSVKSVSYGGAPAPPELVRDIQATLSRRPAGQRLRAHRDLGRGRLNGGPDYLAKPDSCGPAIPIIEVAIVPEDFDGDEPRGRLPHGPDVIGELWIKGPNVVRGYWNKPEATAKAVHEGWLRSGDIARIDDEGFVFIVDRAKDMIIRGGENVYSVIVEAAIFEHPDVADCAVVGCPTPRWEKRWRPSSCCDRVASSRPKRSLATSRPRLAHSKCRPDLLAPSRSRATPRARY